MKMLRDESLIRIFLLLFISSFLFTFPGFFFSVDELSYCSRALAFSEGQLDLSQQTISGSLFSWAPANYPIGTALLLAIFAFFSKNLIFLSGLLYTSVALILAYLIIKKQNRKNYFPFFIALIFPPTIYFSRGLMSEMPSLLLFAFYTYIFFNKKESFGKYAVLGLLGGMSILFRETNLVLCAALVALHLLKNPKYIISYIVGFLPGLIPRFWSAAFLYENLGYVKQYAPFGIGYFLTNLPLYLIILLVLLPGGLFVLYKYQGKFANSIKLTIISFTLLHLVYGYNSGDHSGFLVSLFYNGRYYLPTLPLWIIVYADFGKSFSFLNKKIVKAGALITGALFIIGTSIFYHKLENAHQAVAKNIFENYNHEPLVYDNTAYRYLNPLQGKINQLEVWDRLRLGKTHLQKKAFLVLSHRNNSEQQLKFWNKQLNSIDHLKGKINITEVKLYEIFDGTKVSIFELKPL